MNENMISICLQDINHNFKKRENHDYFKSFYSTGFSALDEVLHGGISSGLTVLGAEPSLGKSSFIWQVSKNLAKQNIEVLYFSLEMSPENLEAKLISSEMYEISHNQRLSKSSDDILRKEIIGEFNNDEQDLFDLAVKQIDEYASSIFIITPSYCGYDINNVLTFIRERKKVSDKKIFVIIDYLQLLQAAKETMTLTDKSKTDDKINKLKFFSKEMDIPIVAISSIHRSSYSHAISLDSFKESGDIEYNADCIMGLQFEHVNLKGFNALFEKRKKERNLQLVVLKQRYGDCGVADFTFIPKFSYFKERRNTNE